MKDENTTPGALCASIGTHVEVDLIAKSGAAERMSFDIVPAGQGDLARGFLGADTPLARAILEQRAPSSVAYRMGDILRINIIKVSSGLNTPTEDAEEKRQAMLRKVIDKSDAANAISFALTFDSKWGDYDPESIESNWSNEGESGETEAPAEKK